MGDSTAKLDKFVENQFYEKCFGIKIFEQMKSMKENSTTLCTQQSPSGQTPLQPLPLPSGWPGYPASTFPLSVFKLRNKSPSRSKRNLLSKLDEIKEKMAKKIQKISCILQESGIITSAGNIDKEGLMQKVDSYSLDPSLKADLKQSIEDCIKGVECSAHQSGNDDAMAGQGEAMEFIGCYEKKKKEACVKKSIREKLILQLRENMSVEEIQNILSRGSANSPLYYSAFPIFENIVQAIFINDYQL